MFLRPAKAELLLTEKVLMSAINLRQLLDIKVLLPNSIRLTLSLLLLTGTLPVNIKTLIRKDPWLLKLGSLSHLTKTWTPMNNITTSKQARVRNWHKPWKKLWANSTLFLERSMFWNKECPWTKSLCKMYGSTSKKSRKTRKMQLTVHNRWILHTNQAWHSPTEWDKRSNSMSIRTDLMRLTKETLEKITYIMND